MPQSLRVGLLALAVLSCRKAPDDVVIVSPEELAELEARGELIEVDDLSVETQRARTAARVARAQAVVDEFLATHPHLEDRLALQIDATQTQPNPDGTYRVALFDGGPSVITHGPGTHVQDVAHGIEAMASPDARRQLLDELAPIVPDHCRALTDTDALGADPSADDLAQRQLDATRCWDDWRTLVAPFSGDAITPRTSPDNDQIDFPSDCSPYDEALGQGNDQVWGSSCEPQTDIVRSWAFLSHLSPTKTQGERGTCVSFATASALEYATSRRDGLSIDISEQYLYSIGKLDVFEDHFDDGLPTGQFLSRMAARDDLLSLEERWGYNPSVCRIEVGEDPTFYRDSCTFYPGEVCSDTSHQMQQVSLSASGPTYLFRPGPGPNGGVSLTDAVPLFDFTNMQWSFQTAAAYADAGWGVVAALNVDADFRDIGDSGLLTFDDDSVLGGHAVHFVRFVPDASVWGGGWVVLRNSWGCNWGDAGYAAVQAGWLRDRLKSLTAIRASLDGLNTVPEIDITSHADEVELPLTVGGRTFRAAVTDFEDGDDCCQVSWWSSADGPLGSGTEVEVFLGYAGPRTIVATVRDSHGAVAIDVIEVLVTNEAPEPEVLRPIPPRQRGSGSPATQLRVGLRVPVGVPVAFSGQAFDANKLGALPCDQLTWILGTWGVPQSGCSRVVTFANEGWAEMHLSAVDGEGAKGWANRWVRAVEWTEHDPSYVAVVNPPAAGTTVPWDEAIELSASIATPCSDRERLDVRWELLRGATVTELGTGSTLSWTPSDDVPGSAAGTSMSVRVTLSDCKGDTVDTLPIDVYVPPS
ncbi:MAG: C1 family peptidase [Myxococcales bacterium]|nr:C1 family peptidase [Myxococcales bacterium]